MGEVRKFASAVLLMVFSIGLAPLAAQESSYLPLAVGKKWVLHSPRQNKPVIFEVEQKDGNGFRVRSTTPWGVSEWTLVPKNGQYFMTAYGTGKGMMPLSDDTLYFDFTRPAGTNWSNQLGKLSIVSTKAEVQAGGKTYNDCIEIRHGYPGGASVFAFAKGVGFVRFGEGKNAFVLDEADSGTATGGSSAPAPPVSAPAPPPAKRSAKAGPFLVGLTSNVLATDPNTPEFMIKRFDQTLDTGVNFIVANGKWNELEPGKGKYKLDSLNYLLSVSGQMPVSFTLRIIDTVDRNVPSDLRKERWNDPKMKTRLFALLDQLAPMMKGRVRWFMLGYEINEYMNRHPKEAGDFVDLYRAASAHLKQRLPEIQVSTTLMFSGIDQLNGRLSGLNPQLDFLALTYAPLNPDFTVQDPSVVPADFRKMKQVAGSRGIVLQEIGYPSGKAVKSSQEKQAEFYRLAFQELRSNSKAFEAVNWMMLGDLSDEVTKSYSRFYGLKNVETFEGALQTMGLFDTNGKPKKSWEIFREQLKQVAR